MTDSLNRKPSQSALLLIGILLTLAVVFAHRFLPERRLSLDSARPAATFFLMSSGEGTPARVDWIDQQRMHFNCKFAPDSKGSGCSFTYLLYPENQADHGTDLSAFHQLNLTIRYKGEAHYARVAIRNFDPTFSRLEDSNSSKFNSVNVQAKDLVRPVKIDLHEFSVPEWWVGQYDLPREKAQPDLSNATALSIDLMGDLAGTEHDIQIDRIEFVGDWISAESWYLGILCAWMLFGLIWGVSQWLLLRRQHRDLQSEKDRFEKLSTIDGLTKVLNRHGIDRFIESLPVTNLPTSVIVVDLDHFKKINDQRGHYAGDRVLRTVGEILRAHTRNTDGLGRWGGEEFVLVCPGAELSKAADLAEKLRHRILQTNFLPEEPMSVTASFGVATSPPGGGFEDAFRQADQALYLAKSRGRNCVVAAGGEQMHTVTGARKGTWALISGRFRLHK